MKARRSRQAIASLRAELAAIAEANQPASVRQLYYLAETAGLIPKTDAGYKDLVYQLTVMRESGQIPFEWIADGTRWIRKPKTYESAEEALRITAESYRRAIWAMQPIEVEIWCEKDSIANVIYRETSLWDVELHVCRGFPSISFMHSSAQAIKHRWKPTAIYYFGDLDPSGIAIGENVERRLREWVGENQQFTFERMAVTRAQVKALGLPTRPTKASDSRAKSFKGRSVELEAIPPAQLREIVRACISQHISTWDIQQLMKTEKEERASLLQVAERMAGIA